MDFADGEQQKKKNSLATYFSFSKKRSPTEWMLFSALVITVIFFIFQIGYFIVGPCAKTDMIIMLDQSASLKKPDYEKTKKFASNLANSVTSDTAHVAVAQFSNNVEYITNGFMDDSVEIDKALAKAEQKAPNLETRIKKALQWVAQEMQGKTARNGAKKTLGRL